MFIHYSIGSVLYRSHAYFYIFYTLTRKETVTEISFTCIEKKKKNPYDVNRTWRLKNGTRKRVNGITRMKPVALNFLSQCTCIITRVLCFFSRRLFLILNTTIMKTIMKILQSACIEFSRIRLWKRLYKSLPLTSLTFLCYYAPTNTSNGNRKYWSGDLQVSNYSPR